MLLMHGARYVRCTASRMPSSAHRGGYALELARTPAFWGTVAVALVTALATSAAAVIPVTAIGTLLATRRPSLRRYLDRERRRRELRTTRDRRETRLEDRGAARGELQRLTELVDAIAARAPEHAERYDLEPLLDRYADAMIELTGCHAHLGRDPRRSLLYARGAVPESRRRLVEARLDCWLRCRDRARTLEHDLDAIANLIRLIAERTALHSP